MHACMCVAYCLETGSTEHEHTHTKRIDIHTNKADAHTHKQTMPTHINNKANISIPLHDKHIPRMNKLISCHMSHEW